MYKVLQQTDWTFLLGETIEQLCIGLYEIQLGLTNDKRIHIECPFSFAEKGRVVEGAADAPVEAAALAALVGRRIEKVTPIAEQALILGFDPDRSLTLTVKEGPYESLQITAPAKTIVV